MSERDLTAIERDRIAEWDRRQRRARRSGAGEPAARGRRGLGRGPPGGGDGALRGRLFAAPRPTRDDGDERGRADPHGRRDRALDLVPARRSLRHGRHLVGGRGAGGLGDDRHGGERSRHRRGGGRRGDGALGRLGAAGRPDGQPDPPADRAPAARTGSPSCGRSPTRARSPCAAWSSRAARPPRRSTGEPRSGR